MIEYLSDLRLFCEICHTLNFRQAGEKLGYSAAVVSMRVKRLETVTGKTLFLRSTRHVVLTEEGRELQLLAEKTLDLAESMSAPRYADPRPEDIRGTVRITSPHSFARVFLAQPLQTIQRTYPNLTLELILEDTLTHLVREGIDISFRVGGGEEQGVDRRELLVDRRIMVASPGYLERHGLPETPEALSAHVCLGYLGIKHWELYRQAEEDSAAQKLVARIRLNRALYCNTGDYLSQLAIDGMGIAAKSTWSVAQALANGTLVRVLPELTLGQTQRIRMLTPKRDVTPVRVRQVLAHLEQAILEQAS